MTNQEDALAYMRANNQTGVYDQTLDDYAAGKINVGIIRYLGPSLHILKQANVLGKYDEIIKQAEISIAQPVIYFTPRAL